MAQEQIVKLRPIQRFWKLLQPDTKILGNLYLFALLNSLVALSLPLGLQAIINLIASGRVTTSFYVLIIIVVAGYAINGYLQILQLSIAELLQRKVFTKSAFEFAFRTPRIQLKSLQQYYAPELMNRFFDTLSIQKGLPKLLIDFASSSLQIFIGLVLLCFYHPFFILFGLLAILLVGFMVWILGPIGLRTSLIESKHKYEVAHWLEEVARNLESFKMAGATALPMKKANEFVSRYLTARSKHFSNLLLHYYAILAFKVLIAAAFLLLGGMLVINQQLNIGQFVAAEIVIIIILASVEKLISSMDSIYATLTAIEKIGNVLDLPMDKEGYIQHIEDHEKGIAIKIENVSLKWEGINEPILQNIHLDINPGDHVLITGLSGSGKSILLQLIAGMYDNYSGTIRINGTPLKSLNLESMRAHIGDSMASEAIFHGSLLENITMGREVPIHDVMNAIDLVELKPVVQNFEKGVHTELAPEGKGLSKSIITKIVLARCIVHKPKLLLLDETVHHVDSVRQVEFFLELFGQDISRTVIAISNHTRYAEFFDKIVYLENGRILEQGSFEEVQNALWFKKLNF